MHSLLYLVHRIPYPPTKGDKVRSYNLLKYLSTRYKVYVGAFVDDPVDLQHTGALQALCEECHLVQLNPRLAKVKSLIGLATGEPLTLPYYRSANMRLWVNKILRTQPIRQVLVFSAAMAQYVISAPTLRRVADLVDVDSDKWMQYAATQSWPYSAVYRREGKALLHYERQIANTFDSTVFVSAPEAELFRRIVPEAASKVWYVNNGVDCDYFSPDRAYATPYDEGERVLVFTGAMDYWPNVDAVVAFAQELFPNILARNSSAMFYVVGARPSPAVQKLAELPHVRVTGAVPDIRPYIAHAKLAVAPLRIARGIQNKVLEAMAMAKPVIASPQAAEGIEAQIGKELIMAADADTFVDQVVRLLDDDGAAIGAAARARVLMSYSWEGSLSRFEHLLAGDAGPACGSAEPQHALDAASSSPPS